MLCSVNIATNCTYLFIDKDLLEGVIYRYPLVQKAPNSITEDVSLQQYKRGHCGQGFDKRGFGSVV